jgi:hypothetical protein
MSVPHEMVVERQLFWRVLVTTTSNPHEKGSGEVHTAAKRWASYFWLLVLLDYFHFVVVHVSWLLSMFLLTSALMLLRWAAWELPFWWDWKGRLSGGVLTLVADLLLVVAACKKNTVDDPLLKGCSRRKTRITTETKWLSYWRQTDGHRAIDWASIFLSP